MMQQPSMGMGGPPAPQQAPPVQPPQWGVVPPPAPYGNPQAMSTWSQQPSQIAPPQSSYPPPAQMQYPPTQENRTLWIGDLHYWMDENYLLGCFQGTEVISAKVIRNKLTGQSEGYGFIEFTSRAAAEAILQTYNGQLMPNVEQNFRLNWATLSSGEKKEENSDHTIFVGDLSSDVTDYLLQETFRTHYPSVKGAKVVIDRLTGRSKGYGFVRFSDAAEQARAMVEMNGMFCSSRPMRIGPASSKRNLGGGDHQYSSKASQATAATPSESDSNNTTIFIGNVDPSVSDDLLRQLFSQYGDVVHVKIPTGKRCGFVQFAKRACAEEALLMLNGAQLGGQSIRLSWGRNSFNRQEASAGWVQPQQDPNQWNSGYYGYTQGYESYGYTPAPQDPNLYAYGAYPGYGSYQQPPPQPQHQQQQ